jgi:hypothetical protein
MTATGFIGSKPYTQPHLDNPDPAPTRQQIARQQGQARINHTLQLINHHLANIEHQLDH